MKKLFIFVFFIIFFVGCEEGNVTYSGLCKDGNGNKIVFSHFQMRHYIDSTSLHTKNYTQEFELEDMEECYFFKDGGKYDKNNTNKESDK